VVAAVAAVVAAVAAVVVAAANHMHPVNGYGNDNKI
jgi:hypothetical protein